MPQSVHPPIQECARGMRWERGRGKGGREGGRGGEGGGRRGGGRKEGREGRDERGREEGSEGGREREGNYRYSRLHDIYQNCGDKI